LNIKRVAPGIYSGCAVNQVTLLSKHKPHNTYYQFSGSFKKVKHILSLHLLSKLGILTSVTFLARIKKRTVQFTACKPIMPDYPGLPDELDLTNKDSWKRGK
jgi:hypothetical protein